MISLYSANGQKFLDLQVSDNSYRHRALMGEDSLTLYFELPRHVEIPLGAFVDFQNTRYTLTRPEALKMHHTRHYEYTLTMDSPQAKLKLWRLRNVVDGRLKFSLTAQPREHLQQLIDNLNRRESGWSIGACIAGAEVLVNYDHVDCMTALQRMAEEMKTEWHIEGRTISLGKVEGSKAQPLSLSYGRGNGFVSGVGRNNQGDRPPVEQLFVQGGERNIDASKYGASTLHMPKGGEIRFDGTKFEGEAGFDASRARSYVVAADGLSVRRSGQSGVSGAEDSLDATEIYPKRVGRVSAVAVVNEKKHFYDFSDASIPDTLDYEKHLIAGEKMTVIFQSGMLAGREFDVKYNHKEAGEKKGKRFELVPKEMDGQTMPNATYMPRVGDEYAVFHCALPEAYINEPKTKQGAEWDLMRKAVAYLYDHEGAQFTFSGELDGIWAKKNWANIGGRLKIGGFVRFSDPQWQPEGVDVRIIGIKQYVNNPHSPILELSNAPISRSFSSTLQKLESQALGAEEQVRQVSDFAQRRLRDAQETMEMLREAVEGYDKAISPIAVKTMQTIVGDESLQFRFVDNASSTRKELTHKFVYNSEKRQFVAPEQMLEHLTLGIKTLTNSRDNEAHKFWRVGRFESAVLDDAKKRYFVYISAPDVANGQVGKASVELSETARPLKEGNRYNLLVGTLNRENGGTRSFAPMFGFTEILPSRITTDRLVASDGRSFFDMANASMKLGNALDFNTKGDGKLRLNGTLVQNEGGVSALIGIFRGVWNVGYTYYEGDEVTHTTPEGALVTYRYIYPQPSRGVSPTNTTFWQPVSRGADGTDGSDGHTTYLHIKYSNDAGVNFTSYDGETVGDYIGQCTDFNKIAPSSTSAYKWSKTKGEQGVSGKNGADGLTPMPNLLRNADLPPKSVSNDSARNEGFAWRAETANGGIVRHEPNVAAPHSGAMAVSCESFQKSTRYNDVNCIASLYQVLDLTAGVTYTFSVYVKGAGAGWMIAWPIDGTHFKISGANPIDEGKNTAEGWKRYAVTFTARSTGVTNIYLRSWCNGRNDGNGGKVYFSCPKLEESFRPTPWTRAQEDFRTDYTELRFAVNGSRTTPPEIKIKERTPKGWTAEQPAVGDLQYLWITSARISGATDALLADWSKPTRISAADGAKGDSPVLAFRGAYDSSKTYYGTSHRVDAVKIGNEYYVARTDAGEFRNVAPPDASKWNNFGANFESVATNLLLAEKAFIENLGVRNVETRNAQGEVTFKAEENGEVRAKGGRFENIHIAGESRFSKLKATNELTGFEAGEISFSQSGLTLKGRAVTLETDVLNCYIKDISDSAWRFTRFIGGNMHVQGSFAAKHRVTAVVTSSTITYYLGGEATVGESETKTVFERKGAIVPANVLEDGNGMKLAINEQIDSTSSLSVDTIVVSLDRPETLKITMASTQRVHLINVSGFTITLDLGAGQTYKLGWEQGNSVTLFGLYDLGGKGNKGIWVIH